MVGLASGMFHLWAFSQRDGTFRQFWAFLTSFHSSLCLSSSSLTFFFSCRSFLLCLRVASFLFTFPHLLGRPSFLYNFDIAHFELFIEISSCQWLTLHTLFYCNVYNDERRGIFKLSMFFKNTLCLARTDLCLVRTEEAK